MQLPTWLKYAKESPFLFQVLSGSIRFYSPERVLNVAFTNSRYFAAVNQSTSVPSIHTPPTRSRTANAPPPFSSRSSSLSSSATESPMPPSATGLAAQLDMIARGVQYSLVQRSTSLNNSNGRRAKEKTKASTTASMDKEQEAKRQEQKQ
ncbi:hypothetical protein D9758_006237 [Tetrapyrgos nigripes]|uniref:Uncharacterized protein n=1 Tax=Tetrapyrgos nigripes TaxID=182062 RepID=A0A8H5GAZ0_9AGAR|nr:hypothetical protein D9758_006237 [Tetrapyrgos nigripes]